jgi:hypothetical protein
MAPSALRFGKSERCPCSSTGTPFPKADGRRRSFLSPTTVNVRSDDEDETTTAASSSAEAGPSTISRSIRQPYVATSPSSPRLRELAFHRAPRLEADPSPVVVVVVTEARNLGQR